ncbi:PWWP domain-containing protein [Schizosaccharomyces japonicus yFS275]|uniref:PWWP domain-containing protein n=1 Tax=Schizosaccharomyces japonicus (strain yFS275 / FY16936) TaxID=402676 RepID=B6JVJ8_SCHJY|nr:PWWP domain-containing protein [Schizosaccharomyces japonicus yFS275]EEB05399.1 PWWP domain-containing protein [Schizosaccharomyces japonicus yFS275]
MDAVESATKLENNVLEGAAEQQEPVKTEAVNDETATPSSKEAPKTESTNEEKPKVEEPAEAETKPEEEQEKKTSVEAEEKDSKPEKSAHVKSEPVTKKESPKTESKNRNDKFAPGTVVLTKLAGFPWWPSIVITPAQMTKTALRNKPKRGDHYIPVQFFPKIEYYWATKDILRTLSKAEIESFLENPRPKQVGLIKAYKMALTPPSLDSIIPPETESEESSDEEEESEEESEASANEAEEEEEEEEEEKPRRSSRRSTMTSSAASRKRRARSTSSAASSRSRKRGRRTPSEERVIEDEDDNEQEEEQQTPAAKAPSTNTTKEDAEMKDDHSSEASVAREKESEERTHRSREQSLFFLRHKLQSILLASGRPTPTENEMKQVSEYLHKLSTFQGIDVELLTKTKIAVALSKVLSLSNIPYDEKLGIKATCRDIIEHKWVDVLKVIAEQRQSKAVPESTPKEELSQSKANGTPESAAMTAEEEKPAKPADAAEAKPSEDQKKDDTLMQQPVQASVTPSSTEVKQEAVPPAASVESSTNAASSTAAESGESAMDLDVPPAGITASKDVANVDTTASSGTATMSEDVVGNDNSAM